MFNSETLAQKRRVEYTVHLKNSKCIFSSLSCKPSIELLGHVLSEKGHASVTSSAALSSEVYQV